ncbi:phage tail tape measure protein [Bifidobacterium bombi]|uniref:Phage-related minor tail protein n=1 Tax=Bifidobacterium bombi DSM 19703 TaxID=1341695 RepID=A0A080N4R5_9BIFI|nr:phage tail tape measure protein [Bifidobacterium bombi]KFF31645.1 phage-related minor tail protein [Bifidobacterium bombi DSM 19703]
MAVKPAYVPVLPDLAEFAKLLLTGTTDAASQAGQSAGRAWTQSMTATSKTDVLKEQVSALQDAESKAKRAVQDATRDISKSRDAAAVAAKNQEAAEKRLSEQVEKYGPASSQAIKAEAQLDAARARVRQTNERVETSEKALKVAKNASKETTEQLTKANKDLAKATEEQPSKWASFGQALEGVGGKSGKLKGIWDGARRSLSLLGVGLGAVGLAQWMKNSTDAAEGFEKQMNLLVTAGGESTKNLHQVEEGIKDIAVQTGISTSQLAEGMYTMEKAQIRGADGLKVLKAAAQGATDEQVDLGVMTNALTSIMRSYNIPADRASSVTNQLVAASGEAKTTMQEFAGSLSTVLPVASAAGIGFDQVGGAIATLTSHGTSAQESTQELANTIRNLQAPNQVAVKEMQQFGISSVDVAQNLGKRGLTGTIGYLSETILQKMGPSGTILLDAFNQSKFAAQDADTMFGKLTGASKELAKGVMDGSVTLNDYRKGLKALPDTQASLVRQWEQMYTKSKGFNDQLKQGSPQAQTYTEALKKIMGGATGMNTALMLSGGSAKTFASNVNGISDAAKKNGKDISTWGETQRTARVQTERFNQMLETSRITLASKFLPAITKSMRGMTDWALEIKAFTDSHKTLTKVLAGVVTGVVGLTLAVGLARKAVSAFKTAFGLLELVWKGSTIGKIVTVVGLLVGAFVLAYNKCKPFHDAVDKLMRGVKHTCESVGKWFAGPFVNFFKAAWNKIKSVFQGFWNFVKAAGHGISQVFKFLITFVVTVFVSPWVIAFNLLRKPVEYLWHNVIDPAFKAIRKIMGGAWKWIDTNVVKPFKEGIKTLGDRWNDFYNNYVRPVWDWIVGKFRDAWNWIKTNIIDGFKAEIRGLGMIWNDFYNGHIRPVWDWIVGKFRDAWNWINDHVIGPFKDGIHDIGQAFEATKDWIGRSWDQIKDAAAKPVHWVVDTVYTNGIQAVWNKVAGAVGLDLKLPDAHFAEGGINPGYAPGQDTILALTSPGEAWMVPEWTRAVGADNVYRWNRLARQSGPAAVRADMGFSTGGIVPGFDMGGIVKDAEHWLHDAAKSVMEFVRDPGGTVNRLIVDPVKTALAGIGAGDWGSLIAQLPIKTMQALVDKVKSMAASLFGGGAPAPGGDGGAGVQRWRPLVLQALQMLAQPASWADTVLRRMNQESGGNPNAINNWDSNAKAGMPSQGLMQVIPPTFAAYAGPFAGHPITEPLANIYAGLNYAIHRYGSLSALDRPGGYADGGIVPRLYDKGGYLAPGVTVVSNRTMDPELVLTGDQQRALFSKDGDRGETGKEKPMPAMQVTINNYGVKDPYVAGTINGRTAARQLRASMMGVS